MNAHPRQALKRKQGERANDEKDMFEKPKAGRRDEEGDEAESRLPHARTGRTATPSEWQNCYTE